MLGKDSVVIGSNLLNDIIQFVGNRKCCVISDANVAKHHLRKFSQFEHFIIEAGEASKTRAWKEKIEDHLLNLVFLY